MRRWISAAGLGLLVACRSAPDGDTQHLERIVVTPSEARRPIGQSQHFTATGYYAGGVTRNLTQRVEWTTSDPAVASAPNTKRDRSRIEPVAAGVVTVSASDPKTGVSSRTSGGDASFTVLGALERISLAPAAMKRRVGDAQRLTATGHYGGGATRNLTQHVIYRSDAANVAAAANPEGDKSRIDALAPGTATISAADPATGITTTASGGDATLTVLAR